MSRTQGRIYDPDGTRKAILRSARQLFGHRGYDATSVRELTAAAGVTKGAFYHHFGSKEEVLEELHATFVDDLQQAFEAAVVDPDQPPADQLRALMVAMLERVDRYRDIVLVFAQQTRRMDHDRARLLLQRQAALDRLMLDVVTRAIETGQFRPTLDPHAATYGILGMCTWAYRWRRPDGPMTPAETADVFASLVLGGLTPPEGAGSTSGS